MAWTNTNGKTGLLVGATELAVHGNEILVYSQDAHFKDGFNTGPMYHASYSPDHVTWELKESLISSAEYVGICTGRDITVIGGIQDNKFVFNVTNNLGLNDVAMGEVIIPDNYKPKHVRARFMVDTHFFVYTGFLVYYAHNAGYRLVTLDEKYKDYNIVDITHYRTEFILLLECGEENAIAYSRNCIDFSYYDVHWPDIAPKSISHNDTQVVIVGHDSKYNCFAMYSTDPISRQWFRTTFIPDTKNDRSMTSFNDLLFLDNTWYIVGNRKELNSFGNLAVSVEGLTYKVQGDISNNCEFIKESNNSVGLDKIYYDNTHKRLYSVGSGIPNGDRSVSYRELT